MARTKRPGHDSHASDHEEESGYSGIEDKCNIPAIPAAPYDCSCGNGQNILQCSFSGYCIEPLAWSLDGTTALNQVNSPLFATIPKELRDMIFVYALTDCTPPRSDQPLRWNMRTSRRVTRSTKPSNKTVGYTSDVAFPLLWTCRAVYFETYTLPLSLNPLFLGPSTNLVSPNGLLPWQFAFLQGLDFSIQQVNLEESRAYTYRLIHGTMRPLERHKGVFIAPRLTKNHGIISRKTTNFPHAFDFVQVNTDKSDNIKRLTDAIRDATSGEENNQGSTIPRSSLARVAIAKPLTHITIRMGATDWWAWTDDPNSTDGLEHLALDPSMGDGSDQPHRRATAPRMKERAEARRNGRFTDSAGSSLFSKIGQRLGVRTPEWGHFVDAMPDIRSLEFVLETFAPKKAQLDAVVECAKTWTFPSHEKPYVLVWDGRVEESRWSRTVLHPHYNRWYDRCADFEVRVLRFVRRPIKR